jgi:hypothetical protein
LAWFVGLVWWLWWRFLFHWFRRRQIGCSVFHCHHRAHSTLVRLWWRRFIVRHQVCDRCSHAARAGICAQEDNLQLPDSPPFRSIKFQLNFADLYDLTPVNLLMVTMIESLLGS